MQAYLQSAVLSEPQLSAARAYVHLLNAARAFLVSIIADSSTCSGGISKTTLPVLVHVTRITYKPASRLKDIARLVSLRAAKSSSTFADARSACCERSNIWAAVA